MKHFRKSELFGPAGEAVIYDDLAADDVLRDDVTAVKMSGVTISEWMRFWKTFSVMIAQPIVSHR